MKKITLIVLIILAVLVIGIFLKFVIGGSEDDWICDKENGGWVKHGVPSAPMPTESCGGVKIGSFKECIAAGNPAMESYPRQCRAGDETFIENIGNELEKIDLIRLDTPRPNQDATSPLVIEGQARGIWFFEGDFPVVLMDWDGKIIAEGFLSAQGEWMTEEFVPFSGTLIFEKPGYKNNGSLILQKDNPSGLPENDDALEVPIYFK